MANPANLTLTTLVANASIARPAGDTIDTNGNISLLGTDIQGITDRLTVGVTNNDGSHVLTVTVKAGATNPPAQRSGVGDLVVAIPVSSEAVIGPFESARFVQADGSLLLNFQNSAGSPSATVRSLMRPKVA